MEHTYDEREFQEECRKFWDRQGAICQSALVDDLFLKAFDGFDPDHVLNDFHGEIDDEEDTKEIFSWWNVDDHFAEVLYHEGEPILKNDYGNWWGRTTFGQLVEMDSVIRRLTKKGLDYRKGIEKICQKTKTQTNPWNQ